MTLKNYFIIYCHCMVGRRKRQCFTQVIMWLGFIPCWGGGVGSQRQTQPRTGQEAVQLCLQQMKQNRHLNSQCQY